jgi:DNA-binding HxlR family transcriptional regulator
MTRTQRQIEQDGLVTRRIYAEVLPRVEYALTLPDRGAQAEIAPLPS